MVNGGQVRFYTVWKIPGHPELSGVWFGPHPLVWDSICARLAGGRLFGSGARLKRFPSFFEAEEGWRREAGRHGLPAVPPLFPFPG